MPKYPSIPWKIVYEILVKRDGEICQGEIGGEKCSRKPPEFKLAVDHKNNDPKTSNYWDLDNLQLLCKRCNWKKNPAKKPGRKSLFVRAIKSVSEKKRVRVSDQKAYEEEGEQDYENKSPELKLAESKEPEYVRWIMDNVERTPNGLSFAEAQYEGSYFVEISPVTARRYFLKLYYGGVVAFGKGTKGNRRIIFPEGKAEAERKLKAELDRIFNLWSKKE